MSGLGGLNKSPQGMVVGMVQSQLPVVSNPAELAAQTMRIVEMVGKARRNMPSMDLVVFPEYSLHGLVSISPLPTHSAYHHSLIADILYYCTIYILMIVALLT